MTEKQALLEHINTMHNPKLMLTPSAGRRVKKPTARATLAELRRWHSIVHYRYACNHFHKPDGAGALVGPNSTRRHPSGWLTGADVVLKEG